MLILIIAAQPMPAKGDELPCFQEPPMTCKGPGGQPPCCSRWNADIFVGGKKTFGLLDADTYEKLQDRVDAARAMDKSLCKWFGERDDSCRRTYGPPRCSAADEQARGRTTQRLARQPFADLTSSTALVNSIRVAASHHEQLQRGLAKLPDASLRPYGEAAVFLSNYARGLQEQLSKLQRFERCMKRELDVPLAAVKDAVERATAPDTDLALWSVGGRFGGRQEADAFQHRITQPRSALADDVRRVEKLTRIPVMDTTGDTVRVLQRRNRGSGYLIFGSHGPLRPGGDVPRVARMPVGFVSGAGTIGTVMIKERMTKRGRELTITGRAGYHSETITIVVVADRDRDGVADAEDRCPTRPGATDNRGCAWPDRDADSVPDRRDKCPDVAGVADRAGCAPPGDQLVPFRDKSSRYGYRDAKTNKVVIPPRFDFAGTFSDGLAAVLLPGPSKLAYGYVDTTGRVVIEPRFEAALPFSEGLAAVTLPGRAGYGFIDKTGKLVIQPRFRNVSTAPDRSCPEPYPDCRQKFRNGRIYVCTDLDENDCFYIDRTGNRIR